MRSATAFPRQWGTASSSDSSPSAEPVAVTDLVCGERDWLGDCDAERLEDADCDAVLESDAVCVNVWLGVGWEERV